MAKDKLPDKDNGSKKGTTTGEGTYVSEKCFQLVDEESQGSQPSSPTLRILDLPIKHRRQGAFRGKKNVSINNPRPANQRTENVYVETPRYPYRGSTSANGNSHLPVITFANMRSSNEPPPRPGVGIIHEFPAYVPWKAEQRTHEDSSACNVCHKCRCTTCQKLCKYPGMRVCGVLEVQSRCDEACIETTMVCVPCVQKTARCPASNAARAEAAAAAAATRRGEDRGGARAASAKCRLRWLLCCLCFPCPYCEVDSVAECSTRCRGNMNVASCECVNWNALKRNNRHRVNAAAAAVAEARDRRRCRDYHYYIMTAPSADDPTAAEFSADKTAIAMATADESAFAKFAVDESAFAKFAADESAFAKFAANKSAIAMATADESTFAKFAANKSAIAMATADESSFAKFAADKSVIAKATADTSAFAKVAADKSVIAKATVDTSAFAKIAADKSVIAKATADTPAIAKATADTPAIAKATAGEKNVGTTASEKKNRFRKFLGF